MIGDVMGLEGASALTGNEPVSDQNIEPKDQNASAFAEHLRDLSKQTLSNPEAEDAKVGDLMRSYGQSIASVDLAVSRPLTSGLLSQDAEVSVAYGPNAEDAAKRSPEDRKGPDFKESLAAADEILMRYDRIANQANLVNFAIGIGKSAGQGFNKLSQG
ncbi:hypothetical protein CFI11_19670 [Thalassococcus sp. S3]|nr:hypothetical protein CFI11_19670 [Thalassococcus sp. S3]